MASSSSPFVPPPRPDHNSTARIAHLATKLHETSIESSELPSTTARVYARLNELFLPGEESLAHAASLLEEEEAQRRAQDTAISSLRATTTTTLASTSDHLTQALTLLDRLEAKVSATKGTVSTLSLSGGPWLQDLRSGILSLSRLEAARLYITTMIQVDDLSTMARVEVERSPKRALIPYAALADLTLRIPPQSVHLTRHLASATDALWEELQGILIAKFSHALEALGWPKPIEPPLPPGSEAKMARWRRATIDLLQLQRPPPPISPGVDGDGDGGVDAKPHPSDSSQATLIINAMLTPIIQRFRFHFMGKRPTNRRDKPEWFLTDILTTIRKHESFLQLELRRILLAHHSHADPLALFIAPLLDLVREKLTADAPAILEDGPLLAHVISEALIFDATLQDEALCLPTDPGVAQVYLADRTRFSRWVQVERDHTMTQYKEVISDPEAFSPLIRQDDTPSSPVSGSRTFHSPSPFPEDPLRWSGEDADSDEGSRSTKSADRLISLFESTTEKYRTIPSSKRRLRFLLDVQLPLLERYGYDVKALLATFERARHGLFSSATGASSHEAISGLHAITTLARWAGSIEWVRAAVEDWNDDVFFLEMWRSISSSPSAARPPRYSNTPSSITELDLMGDDRDTDGTDQDGSEEEEDGLFRDVLHMYIHLDRRIQATLIKCLTGDVTSLLKPYIKRRAWGAQSSHLLPADHDHDQEESDHEHDGEVSSELLPPIEKLTSGLATAKGLLSPHAFSHLWREVGSGIDAWLWTRLVRVRQFGATGAEQFALDFHQGWCAALAGLVPHPDRAFTRISAVATLMSIPTTPRDGEPHSVQHLQIALSSGDKDTIEHTMDSYDLWGLTPTEIEEVLDRRLSRDEHDAWEEDRPRSRRIADLL